MQSAAQIVDRFVELLTGGDVDGALELVDDEVVYDNVPVGPVTGPDGIRNVVAMMEDGIDEFVFVVHEQVERGNVVLNARTDRFRVGDRWLDLPVAGWFEVGDHGRITLWRDYFDLATYMNGVEALRAG